MSRFFRILLFSGILTLPGINMILQVLGLLIFIYFLPCLVPRKHWIRFYACYLTYAVMGAFIPGILLPLQLFSKRLHSKVLIALINLEFMLMKLKWTIRNKENYEKYKGGILVVNHQSIMDISAISHLNDGCCNLTGIAKKEVAYVLPLGLFLWLLGVIFIDRTKPKEAMYSMKSGFEGAKVKKILIFPEGTRNRQGDGLLKFKRGAFKLAIDLKMPIIPVVISPYTFIKSKEEFSGGEVIISCLEPIETENLLLEDVDDLMNKTRQMMENEYFKLSAELGKTNNNLKIK